MVTIIHRVLLIITVNVVELPLNKFVNTVKKHGETRELISTKTITTEASRPTEPTGDILMSCVANVGPTTF